MQNFDTSKLKNAMIDAAILHAEKMTYDDDDPVIVDDIYREKWERLIADLKITQIKHKRTKRLTILLIAALIAALTSCAVIYRKQIAKFVVTVFDKYDKVEHLSTDTYLQKIDNICTPKWIPEGYLLQIEDFGQSMIYLKWENMENEILEFIQTNYSGSTHIIDNEISTITMKHIDEYDILYSVYDDRHYVYTWTNKYKFVIKSSRELTENELQLIFKNIN